MVGDYQDYQIVGDASCGILLTTILLGILGKFGDGKLYPSQMQAWIANLKRPRFKHHGAAWN